DARAFPPTDPRNRDTAFSGLSDFEKVCGVVRGDARYDVGPKGTTPGLDPTKADSAADHAKDGARLDFWHARFEAYRANPRYPYEHSVYKTVFEWTEKYTRFSSLSREQTLAQFRPDGDVDNDGIPNVVDADPSGGLYAEKFDTSAARTKVYFLGGPQIDPALYRFTEFASPVLHVATDPANPDTDGDGLPDAWETRYGRFDAARGIWNLDPTREDSDGDGVTDDKANNDNDVVTWYSFDRRGSGTERTTRTFAFNNQLEFLAGTNPNELSTMGDGVPDGWKAFWGSRITSATYPNLLGARDPSIGTVALENAAQIEAALSESGIAPTADLKGLGAKATGYVRLFNVTSCSGDLTPLLKTGERLADVNPCFTGTNLDNVAIKIARAYGVKKLTYADEARLRTNPYLLDTDGDGALDAYEAHYLVRSPGGNAYPDPVADDGARDADGDGLGVRDECGSIDGRQCGFESFRFDDVQYGAGADPGSADTDGDGIQDGIEAGALINPLDPSDVQSFAEVGKDSDFDGVPDFAELTGKDEERSFGEPIRTNPKDPDSDGDGLLDGKTINLNPADPAHAALIAQWRARGIAHNTLQNGTIDFLGERLYGALTFGMRPDRLDSVVAGVPDGWLAYYNQNPQQTTVDAQLYAANRPSWWNERVHGVWWWGVRPGLASPGDDADADGLNDRNGEDPFPGFNRRNLVVDGNRTITDPADLEDWVRSAVGLEAQRQRAQSIGDGAGDPKTAREAALSLYDPATNVLVRNMRACVAVIDVAAPGVVNKGESFNVTGRVVLNERASGVCGAGTGPYLQGSESARIGVPNRTVLVGAFSPGVERVIGAGFTDANGTFHIQANITTSQRVDIPTAGLPLLGSVSGAAFTAFDPTLLAAGERTGTEANRLVVWVYNTSSTVSATHPQHFPAQARVLDRNGAATTVTVNATRFAVSDPLPVTVKSTTRIAFEAPEEAVNGETLAGELRLLDASGGPLTERLVVVSWDGAATPVEFRNLSTDRNGRINLTNLGIPVGVPDADRYNLVANFTSSDPNLLPSQATLVVRVRHPTNISAALDSEAVTVGETLSVSGTVARMPVRLSDGSLLPGGPVPEASIVARIGGVEEAATADASGRFTIRLPVPGNVAAGRQVVTLRFDGTDAFAPAEAPLGVDVKRMSQIVDLNRVEGPRTIEVTVRGRLVDNEGQGFAGPVEVHSETAGLLRRGLADNSGNFLLVISLEPLRLGSQPLRVVFPGDAGHAPASNITLARITSVTRLTLSDVPPVVVRGEAVPVVARLVDDKGAPVPQQGVAVYWRGQKAEVRVTDADGRVSFLLPTNITERPSTASIGVEFAPAANSIFQPTSAAREVRVVAGVELTLPDRSVARGPVSLGGRIVDDEARPLPGTAVALSLDGV
ncbi:MAG TPA: hypothetical protein VM582_05680, partial [Candidatus Thermoplasmatota archaeon]|nr:hypothetical protein [Candidatus Thermoplasmatota archaeon]